MIAVISVCIFKKLVNISICVAILILKIEEKRNVFQHFMLYFKNSKNETELQKKKFVVFRDVTNCVKSGLQSFMLEISCFVQQK